MSDQHIVVHADIERIVGRVTVVAFEENVRGFGLWLHQIHEREERHAGKLHVELTPRRDAMKVTHIGELWQREEIFPRQRHRILHLAANLQLPLVQCHFRLHTEIKHREVMHLPLAGRQTIRRAHGGLGFARHLLRPTLFRGDIGIFHRHAQGTHATECCKKSFRISSDAVTFGHVQTSRPV